MNLLDRILDEPGELSVRFQPIFELRSGGSQIDSLEGLVRGPKGTNFERADILFDYVRRKRAEAAVDRACILAIFRALSELKFDGRINVNIHASTLGQNPGFLDFLKRQARNFSIHLDRITMEIVEHAPAYNVPSLTANIQALRDLGVRIALDDIGLGNSNYRMILDCRPDYFKLDAFFAQGASYDPDRRAVVKSVMCLAQEMKGVIVAEGVPCSEDLAMLTRMGISLFQANLLCPPLPPQELRSRGWLDGTNPTLATAQSSNVEAFELARHKLLVSAARSPVC